MIEDFEKNDIARDSNELFSKAVKAGKRTYYFDVKSTKQNDMYLTITESKKQFDDNGLAHVEKHKIFLYKEDFEKFTDGMAEALQFIRDKQGSDDAFDSILKKFDE
ncbi:MAG: PUR family DNA/RNA-binding protein [Salinivirgaceae bacterium]|nr:PUR family DNA/RNA-binding protein [Salinivirgaceae bacterium]